MSRHWLRRSIVLLAAAGVFAAPDTSRADTSCGADGGCAQGFTCQMTGVTACPEIACLPGESCSASSCTNQVIMNCEPGPCTSDSDCASGMVCHADTYESCATAVAVPPCAKGDTSCEAVDAGAVDAACSTTTMSTCVPAYDLPCQTSSDCGDNFTCVPDTAGFCSGSAGTATAGSSITGDGGAGSGAASSGTASAPALMPAAEDAGPSALPAVAVAVDAGTSACTTITLSTSSCVPNTIPCSSDGDCPSSWTCVAQLGTSSEACSGSIGPDGGAGPTTCTSSTTPSSMQCVPPYYSTGTSGSFETSPSGAGTATLGPVSVPASAGSATPGSAPAGGGNANTGSNTSSSNTGSSNGARVVVNGAVGGTADGSEHSSGGCAVGPRPAGASGSLLLSLMGTVGLALRRKRPASRRHT